MGGSQVTWLVSDRSATPGFGCTPQTCCTCVQQTETYDVLLTVLGCVMVILRIMLAELSRVFAACMALFMPFSTFERPLLCLGFEFQMNPCGWHICLKRLWKERMSHGVPAAPARAEMPDLDMDALLPAPEEPRPSLAEQFRKARLWTLKCNNVR